MKFSYTLQILVLLGISILNIIFLFKTESLIEDFKLNKEYFEYTLIFVNAMAYCVLTVMSFLGAVKKCCCDCFQDLSECLLDITCIKPIFTFLYYIALLLFLCTGGYFTYLYVEDPQEVQVITENKEIKVMVYSQVLGVFVIIILQIISYFEKDYREPGNRNGLLLGEDGR